MASKGLPFDPYKALFELPKGVQKHDPKKDAKRSPKGGKKEAKRAHFCSKMELFHIKIEPGPSLFFIIKS